jgi:hypothetical protein
VDLSMDADGDFRSVLRLPRFGTYGKFLVRLVLLVYCSNFLCTVYPLKTAVIICPMHDLPMSMHIRLYMVYNMF